MQPGDIVETRKIRVYFQGKEVAGSAEFAAHGPPPWHGRIDETSMLVFLFLGETKPGHVLDANAVLIALGWTPPKTEARAALVEEGHDG